MFDSLNHELLIAKLDSYGFSKSALKLMFKTENKAVELMSRTVLGGLQKIGVPQGSVQKLLLFNIFINDIFYLVGEAEISNNADDTAIYACDTTIEFFIDKLEKHSFEIASWFFNNFMKLNKEKCHVMLYGDKSNDHSVNLGQALIKESSEKKVLRVTLDKTLF